MLISFFFFLFFLTFWDNKQPTPKKRAPDPLLVREGGFGAYLGF